MSVQLKEKTKEQGNNIDLSKMNNQDLINSVLKDGIVKTSDSSYKHELLARGKDNILIRIQIKKCCKEKITNYEDLIKEFEQKKLTDTKLENTLKKNLLNAVSLLDRLQLEWQRYDLSLKK